MNNKAKNCTLDDWLDRLFDHNADSFEKYNASVNKRYWCDISSSKTVAYITQSFENAQSVFGIFSNTQLGHGLWHLVSSSSDIMSVLLDNRVAWSQRERCIRSFYNVFEQLFAKRCSPYLSHLDEVRDNPLNGICYMWWDIFPFWGKLVSNPKIDDLFLEVVVSTLKLNSDSCREGALHGLGHFPSNREAVHEIIAQFLADNPRLRPELRAYAIRAQKGDVL
jgi:hypothetical protein